MRKFYFSRPLFFGGITIGLLDPDGRVIEINRAGRALTEDGGTLVGQYLWDLPWVGRLDGVDEEGRSQLEAAVGRARLGEVVRYTVEINQPAGQLQIDLSLTPVRGATGEVEYIIPEGRDITSVKS